MEGQGDVKPAIKYEKEFLAGNMWLFKIAGSPYTNITELKSRQGPSYVEALEIFQLIEAENIEKTYQQNLINSK